MRRLRAFALLLLGVTSAWGAGCPQGWIYFSEYCYLFGNGANWTTAEANCVKEGAHLASIHNAVENDFIVERTTTGITQNAFNMTWVGAHRSKTDIKKWEWTDGTPMDFTRWYALQPNDFKEECLQIFSDNYHLTPTSGITEWNDSGCWAVMKYVCKKRPVMKEPLPAAVIIPGPLDEPLILVRDGKRDICVVLGCSVSCGDLLL